MNFLTNRSRLHLRSFKSLILVKIIIEIDYFYQIMKQFEIEIQTHSQKISSFLFRQKIYEHQNDSIFNDALNVFNAISNDQQKIIEINNDDSNTNSNDTFLDKSISKN